MYNVQVEFLHKDIESGGSEKNEELSKSLKDLLATDMDKILESVLKTYDKSSILEFMSRHPSVFPTGERFTASILVKLLTDILVFFRKFEKKVS